MLKKIIAVLLILCLSLPVCALAQQDPKPIATYAPQDIPKTPEGVHHYLLLCADTWKCDINNMDNYTDGIMLVTVDTVAHRIMLTSDAVFSSSTPEAVLERLLGEIPAPQLGAN